MKYLGVDYGSKRVGLAVSDESLSFALPLSVLENSGNLINDIALICQEKNIGEIVVGESQDFSMKDNDIMKEINSFVLELKKKLNLPVHLQPEFMTSVEAERIQGKNDMLDASSASLILKSYLDLHTNIRMNE